MTGDRNEVKIDERKVRRYCRKRCSKTRPAAERGCASEDMTVRLLDQRAAGQAQEHVLQRGSADEHGLRLEPALVDGYRRRFAVVGVEQDAIGEVLDALRDPVELAV